MTNDGRITILHTRVVTGQGGGPDKTILRSAKHLDPRRYRVQAAYLYPQDDRGIDALKAQAEEQGIQLHAIPERGAIDRKTIRELSQLCERLSIDIWHSHDYKTDLLGLMVGRKNKIKRVSTVHGFTRETLRTRMYARLNSLCLPAYDRVFAVSNDLLRHCAYRGVHPDKLTYLPNAIELDATTPPTETMHAKLGLGLHRDEYAVGLIARLSKEKAVERAIRLFTELHKTNPQTRLHVVGDGPERGNLEVLASRLGLSGHIHWWGWQNDPREILAAMDMALLTSHREGQPNALLEAMALRVPVAATAVGGVPDLLDHGRSGVLLDPNDEASWPDAITPLLRSPLRAAAYSQAAFQHLQQHHNFTMRMQKVAAAYDELMGVAPRQMQREAA